MNYFSQKLNVMFHMLSFFFSVKRNEDCFSSKKKNWKFCLFEDCFPFASSIYEKMRNTVFTDYKQLPSWKPPITAPVACLHSPFLFIQGYRKHELAWKIPPQSKLKHRLALEFGQSAAILTEAFQENLASTFLFPSQPFLSLQRQSAFYFKSLYLKLGSQSLTSGDLHEHRLRKRGTVRNIMTNGAL